jgi:hypothetical protein
MQFSEQWLVWRKAGEGRWQGEYQTKPGLSQAFAVADRELNAASASFVDLFRARHPEHAGFVGTQRSGLFNFGHDPSHIVRSSLSRIWNLGETFDVPESTVDNIADEFEQFIHATTIRSRFQAQLLNFKMKPDRATLTKELTIRRLTEEEVSAFYAGSMGMMSHTRRLSGGIDEFVIEGEVEELKVIGDKMPEPPKIDPVRSLLDKAMLCLRTFKEGRVGYDYVHFEPIGFSAFGLSSFGYGDLHVPLGNYELSEDEIGPLVKYADLLFSTSEPAMETACFRLSDAEVRVRIQDRIVDAVIGLEALLLAGLAKDDRKSELKYRFSVHFSTLFNSPEERHRAFAVAKDLYDLRSTIAHGSTLSDGPVRVGNERMPLDEASKRATAALRMVIQHFLPLANSAPYKRHEYWERAYFGLSEK